MNKNIMFYYIILALNQVLRELKIMKKNSYSYDDLITCGNGDLFGPGNAKLPLPPMLMFDSCLLYTSPSPRDGLLSRMPSSA